MSQANNSAEEKDGIYAKLKNIFEQRKHPNETVRQRLERMVFEKGVFEEQAAEIITAAIPELASALDGYKMNFEALASDYPDSLYTVMFWKIKPIAVRWIEKNCPEAWFLELFKD